MAVPAGGLGTTAWDVHFGSRTESALATARYPRGALSLRCTQGDSLSARPIRSLISRALDATGEVQVTASAPSGSGSEIFILTPGDTRATCGWGSWGGGWGCAAQLGAPLDQRPDTARRGYSSIGPSPPSIRGPAACRGFGRFKTSSDSRRRQNLRTTSRNRRKVTLTVYE